MSNFLPRAIRHILERTEWSAHEIDVYSALLEKGAMYLSRIALETNMRISSVQYALKNLHKRKMVMKFEFNAKPKWKAMEPEAIQRWYKAHAKDFSNQETTIQQFIDQYDFHPDSNTPTFASYEGMKAVKKALHGIARRCISKKIDVIAILQRDMNEELLQFLQEGCASLRAQGIEVRVLAGGDRAVTGRDICHLGDIMHLADGASSLLFLVDGNVYAMHCDKKGPSAAFVEYPQMAGMLQCLFDYLWRENNG